jgi:hypothetical protein
MSNIRKIALARGMVIECGTLLVAALAPIVNEGLTAIYGVDAVKKENQRRAGLRRPLRELRPDISTWGLNEIQRTVDNLWSIRGSESGTRTALDKKMCFETFFREKFKIVNTGELRWSLERARMCRDNAAHPEFQLVEDGEEFFRVGERVLRFLGVSDAADKYRDYLDEMTTAPPDFDVRSYTILERYYPREYETDLMSAEELWITGTNLRRIVSEGYLKYIEDILSRGGVVKVLMHHPTSDACTYAMIQDRGPASDIAAYREFVHENLIAFCKIRATNLNGRNLLIRTIDYMLTFGLDIINGGDKGSGTTYVRFYPLPRRQETLEDRPIIRLNQEQGTWYDFFKGQFERHWSKKSDGGLAEDLPEDYATNA